jgi:hypothetical protein
MSTAPGTFEDIFKLFGNSKQQSLEMRRISDAKAALAMKELKMKHEEAQRIRQIEFEELKMKHAEASEARRIRSIERDARMNEEIRQIEREIRQIEREMQG